jgi:hypothetical protein
MTPIAFQSSMHDYSGDGGISHSHQQQRPSFPLASQALSCLRRVVRRFGLL